MTVPTARSSWLGHWANVWSAFFHFSGTSSYSRNCKRADFSVNNSVSRGNWGAMRMMVSSSPSCTIICSIWERTFLGTGSTSPSLMTRVLGAGVRANRRKGWMAVRSLG